MYEPTCNDYVLIIDNHDDCYLQIGKIEEIINEPNANYVATYIIEFFEHSQFTPDKIRYRKAYPGYIFEDGVAKVLDFKR